MALLIVLDIFAAGLRPIWSDLSWRRFAPLICGLVPCCRWVRVGGFGSYLSSYLQIQYDLVIGFDVRGWSPVFASVSHEFGYGSAGLMFLLKRGAIYWFLMMLWVFGAIFDTTFQMAFDAIIELVAGLNMSGKSIFMRHGLWFTVMGCGWLSIFLYRMCSLYWFLMLFMTQSSMSWLVWSLFTTLGRVDWQLEASIGISDFLPRTVSNSLMVCDVDHVKLWLHGFCSVLSSAGMQLCNHS